MIASDNTKTYLSKQLTNVHFYLSMQLKEDISEEQTEKFKEGLGTYLENNGGVLYHIRPIKSKNLQLYIVAQKEDFSQTKFTAWVGEQFKDQIEGTPSILVLDKP